MVVVGCGAAATLLLAALSENISTPLDIYLVDDNPAVPLGLAYSASHPSFILNVAAKRMGAYVDKPDDFYHWLNKHPEQWRHLHSDFAAINFTPDDFAPRMIYAQYLRQVFACAIAQLERSNSCVTHLATRVVNMSSITGNDTAGAPVKIVLANEQTIIADAVVFATGNHPASLDIENDRDVFYSPYAVGFLQQDWAALKNVAVIGSGLGMVDAVQFIMGQGFTGNFHVFSRNGLIPLEHKRDHSIPDGIFPLELAANDALSALRLVRRIRQYVRQNESVGIAWQDSVNQLRLQLSRFWATLSEQERARMHKFIPWWNVHRHRIPDWSYAALDELRKQKRLRVQSCCVEKIDAVTDGFQFALKNKDSHGSTINVRVEKLIVCSGYSAGFRQIQKIAGDLISTEEQLIKSMVDINTEFKISAVHNLYAIGPALSGILFETTAIQETRQQAGKIAAAITRLV